MLITVKTHEVQRGLQADVGGDRARAVRHFLAAAHLEIVLADDYAQAGQEEMAIHNRIGAASSFWRAGQVEVARAHFDDVLKDAPAQAVTIRELIAELSRDYPQSERK
jgi:hypothetical protein